MRPCENFVSFLDPGSEAGMTWRMPEESGMTWRMPEESNVFFGGV